MNPLYAKHYADSAHFVDAEIICNEQIASETYLLRCAAPQITSTIVPGQFVMLRMSGFNDPLIGRALAMHDKVIDAEGDELLEVVYLVKGKLTTRLQYMLPGQRVSLWGPLGNGFGTDSCNTLIMVAGGVGITPFLALAREALGLASYGSLRPSGYANRATLLYGVRSSTYVAAESKFRAAGVDVRVCTDDGSRLPKARVPELLESYLDELASGVNVRIATCGPEIMIQRTAELAMSRGIACELSLETPMACGIGVCFSCVAKIRQADGDWDYKRTCVEGPVFTADQVIW